MHLLCGSYSSLRRSHQPRKTHWLAGLHLRKAKEAFAGGLKKHLATPVQVGKSNLNLNECFLLSFVNDASVNPWRASLCNQKNTEYFQVEVSSQLPAEGCDVERNQMLSM